MRKASSHKTSGGSFRKSGGSRKSFSGRSSRIIRSSIGGASNAWKRSGRGTGCLGCLTLLTLPLLALFIITR